MSDNLIQFNGTTRAQLGASVGVQPSSVADSASVTPLHRARTTSTSYGAGITTAKSRHERSVTAVAARYERFEDALLPMVLASGVTGDAAIKVAESIMSSAPLRNQAEAAHRQARDEAARRGLITLA